MLQLNELLPKSKRETDYWTIDGNRHERLPDNKKFILLEFYCENPMCDCEHVIVQVVLLDEKQLPTGKPVATISYSWKSKKTQCHPKLDEESERTPLANAILEAYRQIIHKKAYRKRLKTHYEKVKSITAASCCDEHANQPIHAAPKIGRNDPCHCGSGQKYKKCCLGRMEMSYGE